MYLLFAGPSKGAVGLMQCCAGAGAVALFPLPFPTPQVPNSSPTAGSASTDLYGMAVLDACKQINERIAPYR